MPAHDDHLIRELLVQEREERERRHAQVRVLQQRLEAIQRQTEELQAYRQQYQDHWHLQFRQGATPALMQCYRQFEERLAVALAQQHHTLRHVQGLLDQGRQRRVQQDVRVASIERLLERRRQSVLAADAKAQQRSDDEWAQRAHRALREEQPSLAVSGV